MEGPRPVVPGGSLDASRGRVEEAAVTSRGGCSSVRDDDTRMGAGLEPATSGLEGKANAQGNKRRCFRTDDVVPRPERVERSPRSACGRAARSTPVPLAMRSQGQGGGLHTFRCEGKPALVDAKEHMMSTTTSSTSAARSILTIDEAAAYLVIPKATLYTWRTRRRGFGRRAIKFGGCVRYRRSDPGAWVADHLECLDDAPLGEVAPRATSTSDGVDSPIGSSDVSRRRGE
jgi:hypothetical protein